MESEPSVEFSRIVAFDQIGSMHLNYHVEAKPEECKLLSKRFGLVAIHQLSGDFVLSKGDEPGWYLIVGNIQGDVVQSCVSTLKDVPAHVEATVQILLKPSREEDKEQEFMIDLEDERDIEYYEEEFTDLGEITAQYLYLNLDPFPHSPDAPDFPEPTDEETTNPFAQALQGLKKK
jgi:uncharacterized metal-binding protein YceD (DUF177 family)